MAAGLMDDLEFKAGVRIGGIFGGTLVVLLYVLVATTHDIRARIPFLLQGWPSLFVMVIGVLTLASILAVWALRGLSLRSAFGAALSATTMAVLLAINAPARFIPDFDVGSHGVTVSIVVALAVVALSSWERRIVARERSKHHQNAVQPER